MSLGGLLASRAAAFEPRIKKVIAYDIMYAMMDAMTMNAGKLQKFALDHLQSPVVARLLNAVLPHMASKDVDLAFKLHQATDLTGLHNPVDLLREISRYDLTGTLKDVKQEVLLLAGTDDQYVPYKRLSQLESELVRVKSLKSVTFDASTGADQHCQIGNRQLAINEFATFLNA
ncbi:MAG TPA: hypothetical protein DCW31_07490 [Lactobacillus sp.]|nr:hypothetical protein [Lactobacillus sp.]